MIAMGRPLLADPELPSKAYEGRLEDIRPCIYCNEACIGNISRFWRISCVVNPALGREREYQIEPAKRKKRVLVVGGGPAGMEAARIASLRGHKVTLYEKEKTLGRPTDSSFGTAIQGANRRAGGISQEPNRRSWG